MSRHNQFIIRNDRPQALVLNIEPEGVFFPLGKGEEVSIREEFADAPVTIKLTNSDNGDPIVSIWPGDGEIKVEKDGDFSKVSAVQPRGSRPAGRNFSAIRVDDRANRANDSTCDRFPQKTQGFLR